MGWEGLGSAASVRNAGTVKTVMLQQVNGVILAVNLLLEVLVRVVTSKNGSSVPSAGQGQ